MTVIWVGGVDAGKMNCLSTITATIVLGEPSKSPNAVGSEITPEMIAIGEAELHASGHLPADQVVVAAYTAMEAARGSRIAPIFKVARTSRARPG